MWSDCSVIYSEMFALRKLAIQMSGLVGVSVQWILYCTCDLDKMSRRFPELSHDPRHVAAQMQRRSFEAGKYDCENHCANHDTLRQGVDLYVGTYP